MLDIWRAVARVIFLALLRSWSVRDAELEQPTYVLVKPSARPPRWQALAGHGRRRRGAGRSGRGLGAGGPDRDRADRRRADRRRRGRGRGGARARGRGVVAAMIPIPTSVRVWLATDHTDMRKGFDGLALIVQETLRRDPHSGHLFVFRGRRGDLIKWHCHVAMPRARSVSDSGIVRPLRPRSATWSSPQREAHGGFGLR